MGLTGPMLDWAALRKERVLAETEDYLALDKPAGVSVAGERHETDLVRIAAEAGEHLVPVHRIDKVTSGVVLLARSQAAHGPLTRQFARRTVAKTYLAITRSTGLPESGRIELPLGVGRKNRVRIAAPREDIAFDARRAAWTVPEASVRPRSFPSLTTFVRLWQDDAHTLLELHPHTGRRHQIRVHLAWIGHPIVGDPLFPAPDGVAGRTCLHALSLAFDDAAGERVEVRAAPDEEFWEPVAGLVPEAVRSGLGPT